MYFDPAIQNPRQGVDFFIVIPKPPPGEVVIVPVRL